MGATMQAQLATGAAASWANVETGCKFNLADSATDATAITIPDSTGTNYSWTKSFAASVTGTSTTSISNRRVSMGSSPSTGLNLHWKGLAVASYVQASSATRPASSGSNGAVPSGYTQMTTSPALWDNTSVSTSSTGPNGDMVIVVLGVDNLFAGGAGSATALPNLVLTFDES